MRRCRPELRNLPRFIVPSRLGHAVSPVGWDLALASPSIHPPTHEVVTKPAFTPSWETQLHLLEVDGALPMTATAYLSPEAKLSPRRAKPRARILQRRIAMRVVVGADRRRIFDALTLPEYVEAWLTLPGDHAGCRMVASKTDGNFRFDHFGELGHDLSISGAYRVCRRGKIFFSWRRWNPRDLSGCPDSLVVIRLYGAFAKSTLCLAHSGIFCESDYLWQSDMWERSLKKLQLLFQPRA